jgi:hypothetical protein
MRGAEESCKATLMDWTLPVQLKVLFFSWSVGLDVAPDGVHVSFDPARQAPVVEQAR